MWNTNLNFSDLLDHYQKFEIGFRVELSGTRNYFHKIWYFCRFLGSGIIKVHFISIQKVNVSTLSVNLELSENNIIGNVTYKEME